MSAVRHSAFCPFVLRTQGPKGTLHSAFCIRRGLRRDAGFTLVEILIAMFVFLIGILGVLSLFPVAMSSAGRTIGEVRSNILAQSALAQLTADCKARYLEGAAVFTDTDATISGAAWTDNQWQGYFVTIKSSDTRWQSRLIWNNDSDSLYVVPDWNPRPADTDSFIITRMGLPSLPRGLVQPDVGSTPGNYASDNYLYVGNVAADTDAWNGYSVEILDGNAVGEVRTITKTNGDTDSLTLSDFWDPTVPPPPPVALAHVPEAGNGFAITDRLTRVGYVREIAPNVDGTQFGANTIETGQKRNTSDDVDPLVWPVNFTWAPGPVVTPSPITATGASADYVQSTGAFVADACRGKLVIITVDPNAAGQVRWVTKNTADQLDVYPQWTVTPGSTCQFEVRDTLGYFLVITTGKAAGRVFRITSYYQPTDTAKGHLITCAGVNFTQLGVKEAKLGVGSSNYKLRNADGFMIIGSRSFITTVIPRQTTFVTLAPPLEVRTYVSNPPTSSSLTGGLCGINTFGLPKGADVLKETWTADKNNLVKAAEPQTGGDIHFAGPAEKETSEYSMVCILTDNGPFPDGPVRADVFVYRNFDSTKSLFDNLKPVGYITGYIGRP